MASTFCLSLDKIARLKQAILNGEIDPQKLADFETSEERRDFLASIVGEDDAQQLNARIESKLILKNQQTGLINLFKTMTGLKEPVRRDIVSRVEKMTHILVPDDVFYKDLASKQLGTDITQDEAGTIAMLSAELSNAKDAIPKGSPIDSNERLDYGNKLIVFNKYINDLKESNNPTLVEKFKVNWLKTLGEEVMKLGGISKSLKSVGDIASFLRQSEKILTTHPGVWAKNAVDTINLMAQQLMKKGTDYTIMDGITAGILSRPGALDGTYKRQGISILNPEESLPATTKILNKIPIFGRLFEATRVGYTGMMYKTRAGMSDLITDIAKKSGVDMTDDKEQKEIGKMINSMTGRGSLGKFDQAGDLVNFLLFSPRMIKAQFDFFTAPFNPFTTPFVRKQGALNLLKFLAASAAIYTIAKTVHSKSVTDDPKNTNFGKVVSPSGIAFDFTGGSGTYAVLMARLATGESTSPSTGKTTSLTSGKYGAPTRFDILTDFLADKTSPSATILIDWLKGKDYDGNKFKANLPTAYRELGNAITPFPLENVMQATPDVGLANAIASEIIDALGAYETLPYVKPKK